MSIDIKNKKEYTIDKLRNGKVNQNSFLAKLRMGADPDGLITVCKIFAKFGSVKS